LTHLISLIDFVRDKVIAKGVINETNLNSEAVEQHLKDPAMTVIDRFLVECWGQEPSELPQTATPDVKIAPA
jgi:hypothetical protein